ncbi:membrane protein of unknown function [Micropruina glycogenica]|uniref:Major facilitator superfamily (MFS) profile domain-containing protein n=1 Tax=Micropruina glycogenica TaxID=75385 RepID=A0A2N9JNA1_9ACTN|nr:membrane protein of unknown function [Micropruina glycogenica]
MTAAPTTQESVPTRREWLGLAVLSIGLGLIVLDGTIVGVALPAIIGDLHLDLTDAQWVNSLYAVLLAALLLSTGNLADRWGRKRLFLAGLIVFVAGSLLAAAASTAGVLIGARAVQAVGAAFIMPSTLSTVNAVFRGKYRAAAFGVWGAVISGAAAVGPLAGGALTQWASWHWIFLVNLPLGVLVFIAALFTVPETRGEKKRPGIDVDGALLSAIGFGALVFAVVEGPDLGWWTPKSDLTVFGWVWPKDAAISAVPVAFAVAAIALVLFVIWERHREKVQRAALLDLALFSFSTFSWGNLTAAMVAVGRSRSSSSSRSTSSTPLVSTSWAPASCSPRWPSARSSPVPRPGISPRGSARPEPYSSGWASKSQASSSSHCSSGLRPRAGSSRSLWSSTVSASVSPPHSSPVPSFGTSPSKSPDRDRPPRAPSGRSAPPSEPHSLERRSRSPSRSLSPPPSATRDSPARRRTRLPTPPASPRAPRSCSCENREAVAVSAIRPRRLSTRSRADSPMRPAGRS